MNNKRISYLIADKKTGSPSTNIFRQCYQRTSTTGTCRTGYGSFSQFRSSFSNYFDFWCIGGLYFWLSSRIRRFTFWFCYRCFRCFNFWLRSNLLKIHILQTKNLNLSFFSFYSNKCDSFDKIYVIIFIFTRSKLLAKKVKY